MPSPHDEWNEPPLKNEEVEDLYDRLERSRIKLQEFERLEEENRMLKAALAQPHKEEHPEDGFFKPCGNRACSNMVQVGIRFCPPCRTS